MTKKHIRSHLVVYVLLAVILLSGTLIAVTQSQTDQGLVSQAATVNCTVTATQLTTKATEQQLLNDINTYRAQNGLTKLTMDPTLKQAAAWQTNDMLTHNSLSHTDSLGRSTATRLTNCGYDISNNNAESISNESANPETVFSDWKNDALHNEIMLLVWPNIAGVAMQTSSTGVTYWTVDLGANPSISTTYPSPAAITPTLYCLGSGSCVPTSTPNPSSTESPTQSITSDTPTSGIISIAPSPSTNPSQAPCTSNAATSVQSTNDTHTLSKNHQVKSGYISQFILMLLQLLLELIKVLFGGQIPGKTPTPCVSPTPAPSITPSTIISPTGS